MIGGLKSGKGALGMASVITGYRVFSFVCGLLGLLLACSLQAQEGERLQLIDRFSGDVSITNNGISLVPAFSLNDPALLMNLRFAKGLRIKPILTITG